MVKFASEEKLNALIDQFIAATEGIQSVLQGLYDNAEKQESRLQTLELELATVKGELETLKHDHQQTRHLATF